MPGQDQKFLIWGDLVTAESEGVVNGFSRVTYQSRYRRTTSGWLKIEDLTPVPLDLSGNDGSIEDAVLQEKQIARSLPSTPNWRGQWASGRAEITIKKLTSKRYQFLGDADGALSDGSRKHDIDYAFQPVGALAVVDDDIDKGACAVYLLAFNDAVIAVQRRMCFGSGANSSFPTFAGVYFSAR